MMAWKLTWVMLVATQVNLSTSQRAQDFIQPSFLDQEQPSGQGRDLGLALDFENLDRAMSLFPLVFTKPSRIYVVIFKTEGLMNSKRVDTGWRGLDEWMWRERVNGQGKQSSNGQRRTDSRGGATMYALLTLAQSLPPAASVALVTSRPPSDTDLASQALAALRSKKIKVTVFWTSSSRKGRTWLEDLAISTGGSLQEISEEVSLKQVTLLVRENLKGDTMTKFEVDSSLKDLTVVIKGHVHSARIAPPRGFEMDALNVSGRGNSTKIFNLNGRETGVWHLHVTGEPEETYSVTVEATSHLVLWATATNTSSNEAKKVVELWLEGRGVRRINEVELVDSEGRQLAALGHRETRSHDNTVSSTVELDTRTTPNPTFLRLTATNNNGEQFTRLARIPDEMRLPTSIEVGLGSMLTAAAGQRAIIKFEVANNRQYPLFYDFIVTDNYRWVRYVQPTRSMINGRSVEEVRVELQAPFSQETQTAQPNIVTIKAQLQTGESVTQKAYFRIGQTSYDSTSPSITYSYNGDCSNTLSPDTCFIGTWGANVTLQDSGSGLLKITSKPVALQLNHEFIAGTMDSVNGMFVSTCCKTKVEITAIDTIGNRYTKVIDIERKWLTAGEISAIVLGCLLLILIIVTIIILICWWCNRNKRTLAIYPDH